MPWYDRRGQPITLREAVLIDHRVAFDKVGPYDVSTIWVGVSYSPVPEIFETMVFEDGEELAQRRYTTEEDAVKGHAEMVEKFTNIEIEILTTYAELLERAHLHQGKGPCCVHKNRMDCGALDAWLKAGGL